MGFPGLGGSPVATERENAATTMQAARGAARMQREWLAAQTEDAQREFYSKMASRILGGHLGAQSAAGQLWSRYASIGGISGRWTPQHQKVMEAGGSILYADIDAAMPDMGEQD